jgi:integrase
MRAIDIVPAQGKREDIIFGERLIALGVFNASENIPKGFGLRVRRGKGKDGYVRSWIMQYRHAGQLKRMTISNVTELTPANALAQGEKLRAEVVTGRDPQGAKKTQRDKDKLKFGHVVQDFLAEKVARPNTMRMLKTSLMGHARPLHSTPIDRITKAGITARVRAVTKSSGPAAAGVLRGALSSVFAWAMQALLVENNPVIGSATPPKSKPRKRALSGAELPAVWNIVGDDDYGRIVKLLILTGCRREEIGGMCWSELDLDAGTWTLPGERAKNGESLTLPISPMMMDVIISTPRRVGIDYLFGARGKSGFRQWAVFRRFDVLELQPWCLHDIRRSTATGMANIKIAPHIIETILNHISGHKGGVAGIYNRSLYVDEVKDAMTRWSDHIAMLVDASENKVRIFNRGIHSAS